MGRLKTVGNRLTVAQPRLRVAVSSGQSRDAVRSEAKPWRAWYKTARWQKLRRAVLKRDDYVCQKTGVALIGKYPAGNSPVADHIKPHRGNQELFFDIENIQAVSKAYHDKIKQSEEKRGLHD